MIESIAIASVVSSLILVELAGVFLRRYGFITISEQSRKSPVLRWSITAAFVVGLFWWLVHSRPGQRP